MVWVMSTDLPTKDVGLGVAFDPTQTKLDKNPAPSNLPPT
jgi:hypothetical protein